MAYSNSTTDRMDELRFRMSDSSLGGLVSPPRNNSRLPQPLPPQDGRGGMVRRFTTDSGRVPTIASLTTLRSGQESMDFGPSVGASWLHSADFSLAVLPSQGSQFAALPLSKLSLKVK
jgi:hypothetical protein